MKSTKTIRLRSWLLWGILSVFLGSTNAFAQTTRVSGKILALRTSEPIPGATITVKNTNRTAISDLSGKFIINVEAGEVLVITSIGFTTQEATVGSGELRILLQEVDNQLENVVVIGYGTQKKKLVTGANVQVKGADIQKQSTTNALQALQGQAAGVQITSYSGQPGSGMNVIIRGKGTVGNFGPLYVVDGIQTGDISYLNPADIESIDVLKDAASAAIYGSQAANGVILVTTRTGKTNQKMTVTLDGFYGSQNVARKAKLLNAKEYAIMMNEAAINSGKSPYFTNDVINNLPVSTNWMDKMFEKDVPFQNYVLGVQGGGGGSAYSASLGYTNQGGIVGGSKISNFERYTFRMNSEHNLYQNVLKFGEHLTFNYQNTRGILVDGQYNNTLRSAFGTSPFLPMYDSAGKYFSADKLGWYPGAAVPSSWNNGESNPYADMDYNNRRRNSNQGLVGDVYLQVEPVKGLKFRSSVGLNYYSNQGHGYTPVYHLSIYSFNDTARVWQSMGNGRTIQFDNLLSYDFRLGRDHSFSVMAGSSSLKLKGTSMYGSNWDLRVADMDYAYLSVAQNVTNANRIGINGAPAENALMSYFGRLQYNFREKYLLNATFRADGSSKFAPDHRWGYFPSVSAGWVTSSEDFMRDITWMDYLKVRGSWGEVGNQNVAAYQYLSGISFSNAGYIFGPVEGSSAQGAYPNRIGNPDLKWETSEQTNIGFDATVMKKLNVTFDYYVKKTKDWLIYKPFLATSGVDGILINGGDVKNTGVELALNYHNNIGKLNYSIGVNGAYNKNRIGNIPTADSTLHGNTNVLYANAGEFYRAHNGEPVGYFWGLKTNGIFQTEDEVNNYVGKSGKKIQPDAQPGDVRYVDLNNDGVIDAYDKTNIGDPNPDFTFGFNISLDYKGFDFAVQAAGVAGNQIVQSWRNQSGSTANYSTEILSRWHGAGTSNKIPRVTEDNRNWTTFSDLYIHNGNFLRISTIALGYDFTNVLKKNYLSKLRLYAAVTNAFTFTKYNGMDPEVGYNEGFSSGVDLGYYPRPRTVMIGANIRF